MNISPPKPIIDDQMVGKSTVVGGIHPLKRWRLATGCPEPNFQWPPTDQSEGRNGLAMKHEVSTIINALQHKNYKECFSKYRPS